MDRKTYLEKIINEFEEWWVKDPHSSKIDFYKNTIEGSYLTFLSNRDFVDFFYEFVSKGGQIQSGGYRTKNKFRDTVLKDLDKFKKFVLKPFRTNFSPKDWFLQLDNYPGFSVGIATIFLNRIDNKKLSGYE